MVIIRNDCILITKDDPSFSAIRSDLTFFYSGTRQIYKKDRNGKTYSVSQNYNNTSYVYQNYKDGISIMRGLLHYIQPYIINSVVKDEQNKSEFYDITLSIDDLKNYSSILEGITLTQEQMICIRKMIMCKRCIIQSSTGCFTGDTYVPLLNGSSKTFEELINMDYNKEYVYTCTKDGDISFSKIKSVHVTKYVTKLLKITLDDNTTIQCTPEHPFMLRNGQYKQAQELTEFDSLMPYDCVFDCKGNKAVKHNKYCAEKGRYYRGAMAIHRLVYSKLHGKIPKGFDIHHKNEDHFNDNPDNLEIMSHSDHLAYHNDFEKAKKASDSAWTNKTEIMKEAAKRNIIRYNKSEQGRNESRNRAEHMRNLQKRYKFDNPELYHLKRSITTMKSNCTRYHHNYPGNCEYCKNKFNNLISQARILDPNFESWNHKIKKIEVIELSKSIPVYDLETESELHNFAIQTSFKDKSHQFIGSGIFVHNSGKTEMMCGFLKIFNEKFGKYPTTLIVEPSIIILNGTIQRLSKYGIPVSNYREIRSIVEGVANVCHPKSLINDLKKNPNLLESVNVILGDEVHHMKSIIFRLPYNNANAIDYSIGLSASAIQNEHVGKPLLTDYSEGELNIIGSTGPLVINITSGNLIKKGHLATPAVIVLHNEADEPIPEIEIANWHKIVSEKLYSDNRTKLTCETIQFFNSKNRKILILVNTIEWSRLIMKKLYSIDSSLIVEASYGGGRFEYFDGSEFIGDSSDVFKRFSDGEFNVLIGTSHIYEGADVPNLDVLILAFGGKSERMTSQGIGRVLRKTKNGKYAYVIDFNDKKDIVLSKQYRNRRNLMYKEIMQVPDNLFYEDIETDELEGIFNKLEG